jgi:hypothetical protein
MLGSSFIIRQGGKPALGLGVSMQEGANIPRHDVTGMNDIAHIDGASDDLARDAEAEIGFVPRPHHTDEFASRILVCEVDPLHLHGTLELGGGGGGSLVAGGEQREGGDDAQGGGNLDEARDPRIHVGLLH